MYRVFSRREVLEIASHYEVDQSDLLETFLCELLNVNPDTLYELLELVNESKNERR